jgi:hypothetical protein
MPTSNNRGKRLHVVPGQNGNWEIKPEGGPAIGSAPTQGAADKTAGSILRNTPGGGERITHRPDGRIRSSDTINRPDPKPPVDREH